MIEILIPTFNRASCLEKNLNLLIDQISKISLNDEVSIIISDNCSGDNTRKIVENIIDSNNIHIQYYRQKENIGLEKNAVFLLEKSTDQFIMYVGDDDYLADGYLAYVINKIKNIENLTCIIPGINALHGDGTVEVSRNAEFDERIYDPSFKTLKRISQYGHQLSGVLLKRQGLYKNYIYDEKLRNIYPFMFFLAYNILRGISIYVPKQKVLVSVGNSKDWSYDDSGLLTEVLKNYKILYPNSYIKRNTMNFVFMNQQKWRLRISKNFKNGYASFIHLEKDKNIDLLTKVLLPFYYSYLYMRLILSKVKRVLIK